MRLGVIEGDADREGAIVGHAWQWTGVNQTMHRARGGAGRTRLTTSRGETDRHHDAGAVADARLRPTSRRFEIVDTLL